MDKNTQDALVVWAGTLAGGAGGWWTVAKLGARFGMNIGPWGAVAGGLLGALAGASLSKKFLEASQSQMPLPSGSHTP